ncbi:hypothetical protein KM043_015372 [Ampulex compressa]|nr:hypothetical protein KM043_015372 [Ampulex compressa]
MQASSLIIKHKRLHYVEEGEPEVPYRVLEAWRRGGGGCHESSAPPLQPRETARICPAVARRRARCPFCLDLERNDKSTPTRCKPSRTEASSPGSDRSNRARPTKNNAHTPDRRFGAS